MFKNQETFSPLIESDIIRQSIFNSRPISHDRRHHRQSHNNLHALHSHIKNQKHKKWRSPKKLSVNSNVMSVSHAHVAKSKPIMNEEQTFPPIFPTKFTMMINDEWIKWSRAQNWKEKNTKKNQSSKRWRNPQISRDKFF